MVDSDLDDDDDDDDDDEDDDDDDEPGREITPEADVTDPPSFSRVDRDRLHEFPRFARAHATVRVETEVHAGEVLYLPAGWFHEVTSRGEGEMRCHLALNYWFHPPVSGGADGCTYAFETPYGTKARQAMWERDWAMWEKLHASNVAK